MTQETIETVTEDRVETFLECYWRLVNTPLVEKLDESLLKRVTVRSGRKYKEPVLNPLQFRIEDGLMHNEEGANRPIPIRCGKRTAVGLARAETNAPHPGQGVYVLWKCDCSATGHMALKYWMKYAGSSRLFGATCQVCAGVRRRRAIGHRVTAEEFAA